MAKKGCIGGGCLLPILLFLLSAALGETGGPLFWPFAAAFFGLLGGIFGALIDASKFSKNDRNS